MVKNNITQQRVFNMGKRSILLGLVVVVVGAMAVGFWHSKEPITPPATEVGQEPEFDALLQQADAKWKFLFLTDTHIMQTDIYGEQTRMIFAVTEEMHDTRVRLLWYARGGSLSADGRHLLIPLDYDAECSPDQEKFDNHLLLLDLVTQRPRIFTVRYQDFRLGWEYPTYWLDRTTFLVRITKLDEIRKQVTRVLRYTIGELESPEFIDFVSKNPVIRWKFDPPTLLVASEHEPVKSATTIHAIDAQGSMREATIQEKVYFRETLPSEIQPATSAPKVYLKKVIPGTEPLWESDYWRKHGERYYIVVDEQIVRCSDGAPGLPMWEPELQLFIWGEKSSSYLMDMNGHYRLWHKGHYMGKIPK